MTLALALLAASMMLGCVAAMHLYPVQGPLIAQTPAPVLPARVTGPFNSGTFTIYLPDGEVCHGNWAVANTPPVGAAAPGSSPANDMSAAWDTVYGQGFYIAHVLGAKLYAQATVTGDRGTVFNVEMYRANPNVTNEAPVIKGVATDNKGNIYKVAN